MARSNYYEIKKSTPYSEYALFDYQFTKTETEIKRTRTVYNLLDLLGDIGGVGELIITLFGIFVIPINKHNFVIETMETLYKSKGSDKEGEINISLKEWWYTFIT